MGETSLFGYVREVSIFILTVKAIPVSWIVAVEVLGCSHRVRDSAAVNQENIQQAVVVVVEQSDSTRHGFNEVFLRRGRVLECEINSMPHVDVENRRHDGGNCQAGRQHTG